MMSFFKAVFNVIKGLGIICFLVVFSLFLVSFAYFNHNINTIEIKDNIVLYKEEDVAYFFSFGKNQLNIDVRFNKDVTDEYLIIYATYYYDSYNVPIQLFELEDKRIVVVSKGGEIFLERL